jgi:acyl CoA:acetate/3-ketoacid CoA transferase alpha subunit
MAEHVQTDGSPKTVPVEDAVAMIPDGAGLMISGFMRRPPSESGPRSAAEHLIVPAGPF